MPIYDYECPQCGVKEDVWAGIYEKDTSCNSCGRVMVRLISPVNLNLDYKPYYDENLASEGQEGQWVQSRQDRKEKMKRLGLVDTG
jgi:putative FmdB family regulatory protein